MCRLGVTLTVSRPHKNQMCMHAYNITHIVTFAGTRSCPKCAKVSRPGSHRHLPRWGSLRTRRLGLSPFLTARSMSRTVSFHDYFTAGRISNVQNPNFCHSNYLPLNHYASWLSGPSPKRIICLVAVGPPICRLVCAVTFTVLWNRIGRKLCSYYSSYCVHCFCC